MLVRSRTRNSIFSEIFLFRMAVQLFLVSKYSGVEQADRHSATKGIHRYFIMSPYPPRLGEESRCARSSLFLVAKFVWFIKGGHNMTLCKPCARFKMTRIKLFMVVGAFMMGLIYFQPESAILLAAQLPASELIAGIIVVLGKV